MSTLRIKLFGNFQVEHDGRLVEELSSGAQRLLAYLSLYRRAHPLDYLAATLWPQSSQLLAERLSLESLDELRSVLGSHWLYTSEGIGLAVTENITVDVETFEAAARHEPGQEPSKSFDTILLAQAEVLVGWQDEWVTVERKRLRVLYFDALARLLPALEAAQHYRAALACARVLQDRNPAHESDYERLIHLFVLRGSRLDALSLLDRRLRSSVEGTGFLLLISAQAGLGKTSLALTCRQQAADLGALFVIGRCYEWGAAPYALWREIFSQLAAMARVDLDGLPEPFGGGPSVSSAYHLWQSVTAWLRKTSASTPLVLLLDDLHWVDPDSLALLELITRDLSQLPILVIATYRTDQIGSAHPLYHTLPILQHNRRAETVYLRPLTVDDIRRLIIGYLGPPHPHLTTYIFERAEGHPLFSVELLNDLVERAQLVQDEKGLWVPPQTKVPVPRLLRQIITRRVSRLGESGERLLETAAIVGEVWNLAIVEAALDFPEDTLLDVLEQALDSHLIRVADEDKEQYRFGHGLIHEVLYSKQLGRRRKQRHRQITKIIANQQPENASALAHHAYEGELWKEAYHYYLTAGDEARRRFATSSALRLYQRALAALENLADKARMGDFITILERLARAHQILEQKEAVEVAYARMRDIAQRVGNRQAEGQALIGLGYIRTSRYELELAETTLRQAQELAEQIGDEVLLARALSGMGLVGLVQGQLDAARRHFAQAIGYAGQESEPGFQSGTRRHQAYVEIWTGNYQEAEHLALEALELARDAHDILLITGALQILSYVRIEFGRYSEARKDLLSALATSEPIGAHHHQLPRFLNQMGYLYLELGAAEEALEWDRRALEASRRDRKPVLEMERYSLLNVATDLLRLGRTDEALAVITEFEAIKDVTEFVRFRYFNRYQLLRAEVELQRAEFRAASDQAQAARKMAMEYGMRKNVARSFLLEGQALLGMQRGQEAKNALRRAVVLADELEHGSLRWVTRLYLGEAGDKGAREQALELVDEVARSLHASPLLDVFLGSPLVHALKANESNTVSLPAGLTERELEVLQLIARGATNRQIATTLHISVRTVTTHVTNILNKTGCDNRTAAATFAMQHNLLDT